MNSKMLFLFLLCYSLGAFSPLFAQKNKAQVSVGLHSSWLFAGELNASYNFLTGAEIQYDFPSNNRLTPFVKNGFQKDVGVSYANLSIWDASVGLRLTSNKNLNRSRMSWKASIGGMYLHENFGVTLADRTTSHTDRQIGWTAQIGGEYAITSKIYTELSIQQLAMKATTLQLGVKFRL